MSRPVSSRPAPSSLGAGTSAPGAPASGAPFPVQERTLAEVDHRACESCGASFVRRDGEPPYKFRQRRFCSNSCRVSFTNTRRAPARHPGGEGRCCEWCRAALVRGADERRNRFMERRFCSKPCAAAWRNVRQTKPRLQKPCVVCGTVMVQPHGLSAHHFNKQQCCGQACASKKAAATAAARRAAKPRPVRPSKVCEQCGRSFSPMPSEFPSEFAARKLCSKACNAARSKERVKSLALGPTPKAGKRKPMPVCETVEEWLAAGGTITRIPGPVYVPGPNPVRPRMGH